MFFNFVSKRNVCDRLPVFIRVIFILTKLTGTFPFRLSRKNDLVKSNGIFYIFLPILLTCSNIAGLILSKSDEKFSNEKYFAIIVQFITHVNCAVYVFVPFYNKTRIQFGINTCLIRINEESKNHTLYPFSFFTIVFVMWTFFNLINPIIDRDIFSFLFFLERFIMGLLEVQMCFLLYYMRNAFLDIRENIKIIMEFENGFDRRYFIRKKSVLRVGGSLENYRREHLILYKAMDNLNSAYGLVNFMLTMRERFSFAYYLYCWISKGKIFNVVLASVNFVKIFLLFYSFQMLKNEEIELKRSVKELDFNTKKDTNDQLDLLKKQIHFLTIKFEACGLFSMDLNMIISIITTTAGYLLLLNQLNL